MKTRWKSDTSYKSCWLKATLLHGCFFHGFSIVQMVPKRPKHLIYTPTIFSKTFKCSWLTEHFLMHRLSIHFRPIFRFYTPENIREIMVFWCFRGVHKRIIRLKCVKNYLDPGHCPVANLCKILENRLLNISRQNQFMSSSIHKSICFIGSWRYAKLELKFSCKSNIPHIPNFERIQ